MIPFLAFGGLTVLAIALLVLPLLRTPRAMAARAAYDLEVYRDQLRELEQDLTRGLITPAQRDAARREVERRILALDLGPMAWVEGRSQTARLGVAAAIVIGLPLAAGAIYLGLGSPAIPDQPLAARERPAAEAGDIATLVDGLAERLKADPNDVEGWTLLARSYSSLGRHDEAVEALRTVARLRNDDPSAVAMLAEHMVFAAEGMVTPEAAGLFARVRAVVPGDPAAAFYLGLAREQSGDAAGALALWVELGRVSAADAPWLANLRDQIVRAAEMLGEDPAIHLAGVPEPAAVEPGPDEQAVAAAADMAPEDQQAMIRGMVEGLAARLEDQPDDLEGWTKLGRAYGVLGEAERSRDAYARAARLAPDDAAVLAAYGEAMVAAASDGPVSDAAALVFRRLLEIDRAHPSALWYLGRAAAETGQAAEAKVLWQRLRDSLPAGSPERAQVEAALGRI
ncbi:MAG: c-type cytochrome biogenesis protein CcmI [Alphaproteobacteria bacterium]|nr:c-type cytochrome biogenesis protein CcmI [Alphaproteobacteria bacterium]